MNKIWNATRFALAALKDFEVPADGVNAVPNKSDLSTVDQWIVNRTAETAKVVDEALSQDRFADAANALYHFVWNDFCDWYLEFVKPIIYGEPSAERSATQLVLAQTLNRIMRFLHPFVPFISEEIYQKLPIRGEACIVDQYPRQQNDRAWLAIGSANAAFEMELVKETITAIRNIRGENQIKPGVQLKVRLAPADDRTQKILQQNKTAIMRLARLESCEIGEAGSLAKTAVSPVRLTTALGEASVDVIVPLEGVVDINEEITRIGKLIEKLKKDSDLITKKLSNENYVKNAPDDIVTADRALLETQKAQLERFEQSLKRLQ